ncbi:MAG: alkaline phosphatase family protein [Prevotella sp.]|nr:alkaline phosphatase family protein [Prevotella sp.]
MTNKYLYITLLSVLGFNFEAQGQEMRNAPRLVVNITIDQLRNDFLEAFMPLYGDYGFKHLMAEGMVFKNASFPFAPIDRASAIAAISSGVTPYYNKIVGEKWLDRKTLRPVYCVDDSKYAGINTSDATSPVNLCTSTLGDELKVGTGGRSIIYAIAPYRDAAVLSAGHAADGALWLDDKTGNWCSSKYFFSMIPAWVQGYNGVLAPQHKIKDVKWEPVNEFVGNFSYFMQTGMQEPFKHVFKGDRRFCEYKASGLINEDITDLAIQCVGSCGMGNDRVTDMICLTYYAGNYDHRSVTDCQMELQDTYVRLDRELSRLIKHFEEKLGRENILVVLTSTGYSDEDSADYERYRIPTGTFYLSRTSNLLNMYFGALWGQGKYVEAYFHNQIFLNHQLLEAKKISLAEATNRAQEFLAMMSGVRNVYTSLQLITDNNEHLRAVRNGFNAELYGDIIIETAPGWKLLNEDTQESSMSRATFIPFPIIFYGANTKAELIATPVTTNHIAPTIARAIRIRAPNACSAAPLF